MAEVSLENECSDALKKSNSAKKRRRKRTLTSLLGRRKNKMKAQV
jgi:hypothetical protein